MGRSHNALDIHLASHVLHLRGTGVDAESAVLRGSVVLNLVEPTAFKEITMRLRRKSRVPNHQNDGTDVFGYGYLTNVLFIHDWSFLEGDFNHPPTLKAGRHVFPFQFELEGWLPSSLSIHGGLGGIRYKLGATAVRPVFAPNLHATATFRIIRSFTSEALEYQQSLDIEDTWPDKLMYSLMLPHKAWAAGDTVTTLVKFSPLMKGVCITDITTTIQQLIKTYANSRLSHEETCTITTAQHEIRNGHAIALQLPNQHNITSMPHRPTPSWSSSTSPVRLLSAEGTFIPDTHQPLRSVSSTLSTESGMGGLPPVASGQRSSAPLATDTSDVGEEDVSTTLSLALPAFATPSHAVEPIVVSHRINWRIFLMNPDGHMSELYCSLPLHVLDHAVLDDARIATHATRRLLFDLEDPDAQGLEELELPSYPAHVLDCVANASLLETIPFSNSRVTCPAPRSSWPAWRSASSIISALQPSTRAAPLQPSPGDTRGDGAVAQASENPELHRLGGAWRHSGSSSSNLLTPTNSIQTSRHTSRASSRAGSPGPGGSRSSHESRNTGTQERRGRNNSLASLRTIFEFISSFHLSRRNNGHQVDAGMTHSTPHSTRPISEPPTHTGGANEAGNGAWSAPPMPDWLTPAFGEVPHYDVATRGFLGGGVTSLASMRGLPSYEEAERGRRGGAELAPRTDSLCGTR